MRKIYQLHRSFAAACVILLGCLDTLGAQNNTLLVGPTSLSFTHQAGGAPPAPQSVLVAASGDSLNFSVSFSTVSGGSWLSVSSSSGNTPSSLSVFANPAGLAAGNYNGSITITAGGVSNSPLSLPVTLTVSATSQFGVSPGGISFVFQTGGATPPSQMLSVMSSGSPLIFTASAATSSGGNWLLASPAAGATPGAVSVGVSPNGLAAGSYNGSITLAAPGSPGGPLAVPVALTVSANPYLTLSSGALSFSFQTGGAAPASQILSVSTSGAPLNVSVSTSTSAGGNWLVASPLSGPTPSSLTIAVNSAGLAPGNYSGAVTIASAGASNSPLLVPVAFTVSANPLLSVSPGSLSAGFQIGGAAPALQSLTVASSVGALNYAVSAATAAGGAWLAVGPLGGTTPGTVTVAIHPGGLAPGVYQGSIQVSAPGGGNNPLAIPVSLTVSGDPLLSVNPGSLAFGFQIGGSVPAIQNVSIASTGVPLGFSVTTATDAGGNWLAATPAAGATPGTLAVSVNPAGLAAGVYRGTVSISSGGPFGGPQTLRVTLTVSDTALMVSSPSALTFTSPGGGGSPSIQTVSLTSTDITSLSFSVSTTTGSGGNWLLVGPLSGSTPANLNVTVNPAGLSPGTYTGSVVIASPPAPNSPQTTPVTLRITPTTSLAIAPASLNFSQVAGGPSPAAQTLSLSSSGSALSFLASATASGGNWLSASPAVATTPGSVTVSVNAAGLAPGTYSGSITVTSTGAANSPLAVPVNLTVTAPALALSPSALSFSFLTGGAAPGAQPLAVSGGGTGLTFAVSATTAGGGGWLSATPASGTTPANLSVAVNPAGLAAGVYNGTITITAAGVSNSPQAVNVTLTVTTLVVTPPSVTAVVNAGSFLPTAIAPGLIVTIFGSAIGPATPALFRPTPAGLVETTLAETRVWFDGIAAPLLFASNRQVSAVAPYALAGRFSARMQVEYQGMRSNAVELRVVDAAPAIFTLEATGAGPGAILNQNLTVNTPANPARRGTVVAIYAMGEGQTSPGGADGLITGSVLRRPLQEATVTIGGQQAEVLYVGSAPGLVSGVLQINARVPERIAAGNAPVILTVGNAASQAGVTLAVE